MNELGFNSLNIAVAAMTLIVFIIALVVWFFLNRVSVRANEQIMLLSKLLEQQKQQTELLMRLSRGALPDNGAAPATGSEPIVFKDFIAER